MEQLTISNGSCSLVSRIRGALNKAMVVDDVSEIEGIVRSTLKSVRLYRRKKFIGPTTAHANTFLQNFTQCFPGRLALVV